MYFNGKLIEQVHQYKYLGVLVRSVNRLNQDIFADNYRVISDKSRKATFGMNKKLKCIQNLPPSIRFDMFDTFVRPVLTYGSDVWGMNKSGQGALDKLFLHYARCIRGVKATTCNVIVYGECGKYPPSIFCPMNVLCYLHRLLTFAGRANYQICIFYTERASWPRISDMGYQGIWSGWNLQYRYGRRCHTLNKTV